MERRQLEYFLAIAEAGSITHAARVLSIAQPSLSAAMRGLEAELGTQLFERHGRGVRLSPAGQALVRPARRTLRAFEQAAGAARGAGEDGFAELRIVTNTAWAIDPLVEIVGELRQLQPGLRLQITDPASRTVVVEQVRTGEADFGLLAGTPPGEPLAHLHLRDVELVAVMPPGADHEVVADLAGVARHGLIATPVGSTLRVMLDDCLADAGLDAGLEAGSEAVVVVETAHVASVVPLVLAGAGATLLPEAMALDAGAKGARLARLDPPVRAAVHLVWRRDQLSGAGRALVSVARDLRRG